MNVWEVNAVSMASSRNVSAAICAVRPAITAAESTDTATTWSPVWTVTVSATVDAPGRDVRRKEPSSHRAPETARLHRCDQSSPANCRRHVPDHHHRRVGVDVERGAGVVEERQRERQVQPVEQGDAEVGGTDGDLGVCHGFVGV